MSLEIKELFHFFISGTRIDNVHMPAADADNLYPPRDGSAVNKLRLQLTVTNDGHAHTAHMHWGLFVVSLSEICVTQACAFNQTRDTQHNLNLTETSSYVI